MRKIILFIFLFLFLTKTYALEIGTWTSEINDDPMVVVEDSEVRYQCYQNVKKYSSEYYIEGENDALYSNIDLNDYIETDFSEWSDEFPLEKLNRTIETKASKRYRTLRPIRYLFFEDFDGGLGVRYKIAEINIKIDDEEIPIEVTCNKCSPSFETDVNDNIDIDKAYVIEGGDVRIDLKDYYNIEKIRIELKVYNQSNNPKRFYLYYNEGDTLNDRNYAYKEMVSYVVPRYPESTEKHWITTDNSFIVNPIFTDWIYTDELVHNTYYRQTQAITLSRFKDVKYRYYFEEKEYIEGYYKDCPSNLYQKNEDSATIFYLYRYVDSEETLLPSSISNVNDSPSDDDIVIRTDNNINRNEKATLEAVSTIEVKDLLVDSNDNDQKKLSKVNATIEKNNPFIFRRALIIGLTVVFIIIFLMRRRHRNLSYQK